MKVGMDITDALYHPADETGIYTRQLVKSFRTLNPFQLSLRLFCPSEEYTGLDPDPDHPAFQFGSHNSLDYRRQVYLPRIIAQEKIDLFHDPATGNYLPEGNSCPLLTTIGSLAPFFYPQNFDSRFHSAFSKKINNAIKKSTGFIVPSRSTAGELADLFNIPEEKIFIIPGGADSIFLPEIRNNFSFPNLRIPYILFASLSGSSIYNPVFFISLWQRLLKKNSFPHQLVMLTDKRHLKRLEHLIAHWKLENVFLFTGRVSLEVQEYLYHHAELFLYPVEYDSFCLPLLKALSSGLPVVASDIPPIREILPDSTLLPCIQIDAWAETISRLLDSSSLRVRASAHSLKSARHYSWAKTVEKTIAVYQKCAG